MKSSIAAISSGTSTSVTSTAREAGHELSIPLAAVVRIGYLGVNPPWPTRCFIICGR
jgi:hypothetical protein